MNTRHLRRVERHFGIMQLIVGSGLSCQEIAHVFSVTPNVILEDIRALKNAGAGIVAAHEPGERVRRYRLLREVSESAA